MLDVLHHSLLEIAELAGGEGVGLADDGDDVNAGREAAHKLNVELAKAAQHSTSQQRQGEGFEENVENERMTGRGDEVEEGVNTVVAEARVALDAALLGENVVVLPLEVAHDLAKAVVSSASAPSYGLEKQVDDVRELVVDLVTETGSVDDGEGDANAVLVEFCRRKGSATHHSREWTRYVPTLTGLILIPSSKCACSGTTGCLCERTGLSQRVLTKVVRPVPDCPVDPEAVVSSPEGVGRDETSEGGSWWGFRGGGRERGREGEGRTADEQSEAESLLDGLAARSRHGA